MNQQILINLVKKKIYLTKSKLTLLNFRLVYNQLNHKSIFLDDLKSRVGLSEEIISEDPLILPVS